MKTDLHRCEQCGLVMKRDPSTFKCWDCGGSLLPCSFEVLDCGVFNVPMNDIGELQRSLMGSGKEIEDILFNNDLVVRNVTEYCVTDGFIRALHGSSNDSTHIQAKCPVRNGIDSFKLENFELEEEAEDPHLEVCQIVGEGDVAVRVPDEFIGELVDRLGV